MLFVFVLFLNLFVSFNKGRENSDMENANRVSTNRVLANLLKISPENIVITGNELMLDTYLWRDFMPGVEENESRLIGVIKFKGQSGFILSNAISISKVYVINNNEMWVCDTFETRVIEPDLFEIVVKDGPKWEPGINVDAICEFKNEEQSFRLMAKSQKIDVIY